MLSFSFISLLAHGDDEHDGDLIYLFKIGIVHTSKYLLLTTMQRTSSCALMLTVAVVVVDCSVIDTPKYGGNSIDDGSNDDTQRR